MEGDLWKSPKLTPRNNVTHSRPVECVNSLGLTPLKMYFAARFYQLIKSPSDHYASVVELEVDRVCVQSRLGPSKG